MPPTSYNAVRFVTLESFIDKYKMKQIGHLFVYPVDEIWELMKTRSSV